MRHHLGTPLFFGTTLTLAALGPSCDSPTQRAITDDFRDRVDAILIEAETHRSDSDFRHTDYTTRDDNANARSGYAHEAHYAEESLPHLDDTTLLRQSVLRDIADQYFEAVHVDTTLPIDTIISRLDPFSHHFTEAEYAAFMRSCNDEARRYGVQLQSADGKVILTHVAKGSAAEFAGILPGDEVRSINGHLLHGNDSVGVALLGADYVKLLLFRSSANETYERGLSKANCPESSVPLAAMIDTRIGYVKVTGFHRGTSEKLHDAIEDLLLRGMTSLVLDLRGNPGGYLDEAIDMANLFVHDAGRALVTDSRVPIHRSEYTLSKPADFPKLPLAVLVDNGSCSASEIFAGIVQDLDRAVIVGQPTIGKSLVMNFFRLPKLEWLYLTVAAYKLPTGRCVQRPYTNGVLVGGGYREFGSADNHGHGIDSNIAEGECPVYKTVSGRSLYGNTGIVPEYLVAQDCFAADWIRDVVWQAAASYLWQNAGWLLHTTLDSFSRFCEMPQALVDTVLDQLYLHDTTKTKHLSLQQASLVPKIVMAYVAWCIWSDAGFFNLWGKNNATVRRAVGLLSSNPLPLAIHGTE